MVKGKFDSEGFYAALDGERISREMSWKQVASLAGISASTLTRMGQGKRPDVDSLAALARWSGLRVDSFVGDSHPATQGADSLAQITTLLRADRKLSPKAQNAIEAILKAAYEQMKNMD